MRVRDPKAKAVLLAHEFPFRGLFALRERDRDSVAVEIVRTASGHAGS